MVTCLRQFKFEAAHRIYRHTGRCSNIHGHSYMVDVELKPKEINDVDDGLDELGMVIDFSNIKKTIGEWIDDRWDHAIILYDLDPLSNLWENDGELQCHRVYHMPYNATAENMAIHLGVDVFPKLVSSLGVEVTEVTVWETEHCCARWTKDGD